MDHLKRTFISKSLVANVCLGLLLMLIFLDYPLLCQSHSEVDHDHHHGPSQHAEHEHAHDHDKKPSFKYSREANEDYNSESKPVVDSTKQASGSIDMSSVWFDSITSTLVISAVPFFILYFVPLDRSKEHEPRLKILLGFASGGLLGDAFLHLIPHAQTPHSHSDGHDHGHHGHDHSEKHGGHDMSVGLAVLGGIIFFLIVEKIVLLAKGGHGHSHSHSSGAPDKAKTSIKDSNAKTEKKKANETSTKKSNTNDKKKDSSALGSDVRVSAYLNLAADFAHNFTDGLAIGATFMAGRNVGLLTTISILFHEIPHEIGDFAILIQSGCSKKKAMLLQLVTAVGALAGTVVSLCSQGSVEGGTNWVLSFTAGGFIYVATVTVIPELLVNTKFRQSSKEVAALLLGVLLMYLIALYE